MNLDAFRRSAELGGEPPSGLTDPLRALWLCKAGRWHDSHNVAQEIHTPLGSWIHALLHLIEGDLGNAGYWYARAGKSPIKPAAVDAEWEKIAAAALAQAAT
jgi:hypothetical protein